MKHTGKKTLSLLLALALLLGVAPGAAIADTGEAQSGGATFYTMEFTYKDEYYGLKRYVLNSGSSVKLSVILDDLGISYPSSVSVDDKSVLKITPKGTGEWIVSPKKAENTTMRVKTYDREYEIAVTAAPHELQRDDSLDYSLFLYRGGESVYDDGKNEGSDSLYEFRTALKDKGWDSLRVGDVLKFKFKAYWEDADNTRHDVYADPEEIKDSGITVTTTWLKSADSEIGTGGASFTIPESANGGKLYQVVYEIKCGNETKKDNEEYPEFQDNAGIPIGPRPITFINGIQLYADGQPYVKVNWAGYNMSLDTGASVTLPEYKLHAYEANPGTRLSVVLYNEDGEVETTPGGEMYWSVDTSGGIDDVYRAPASNLYFNAIKLNENQLSYTVQPEDAQAAANGRNKYAAFVLNQQDDSSASRQFCVYICLPIVEKFTPLPVENESVVCTLKIGNGEEKGYDSLDRAFKVAALTDSEETKLITLKKDHTESAVFYGDKVTIDLNGHTWTAGNTSALTVASGAEVTLNDSTEGGKIVACSSKSIEYGGALYIKSNGKLTMNGGTITMNSNPAAFPQNGGGVAVVGSGAAFTMTGGAITGCKAGNGGGIYAGSNSTVTVSGGTVSGNTATANGGGIALVDATGTVSGATVGGAAAADGNTARNGGGIYASQTGGLTLSDATVSHNTATGNGGGVYKKGFTVTGNTLITHNTATGSAPTDKNSLENNTAGSGGGVYGDGTGSNGSTLTLTGNTAVQGGGGYSGTDIGSTGYQGQASITGNTAVQGGGWYGVFCFTGATVIKDNSLDAARATEALPALGPNLVLDSDTAVRDSADPDKSLSAGAEIKFIKLINNKSVFGRISEILNQKDNTLENAKQYFTHETGAPAFALVPESGSESETKYFLSFGPGTDWTIAENALGVEDRQLKNLLAGLTDATDSSNYLREYTNNTTDLMAAGYTGDNRFQNMIRLLSSYDPLTRTETLRTITQDLNVNCNGTQLPGGITRVAFNPDKNVMAGDITVGSGATLLLQTRTYESGSEYSTHFGKITGNIAAQNGGKLLIHRGLYESNSITADSDSLIEIYQGAFKYPVDLDNSRIQIKGGYKDATSPRTNREYTILSKNFIGEYNATRQNSAEKTMFPGTGSPVFLPDYTDAPGPGNSFKFDEAGMNYVTHEKLEPMVKTAPRAPVKLTYTGADQPLLTGGENLLSVTLTENGTYGIARDVTYSFGILQYRLQGQGDSAWSETVPTGNKAGTYLVEARVKGDKYVYDSAIKQFEVKILPPPTLVTAPTGNSLTYNGSSQNLVTAGTVTNGTLEYSLDGENWSTDIPTAKDVISAADRQAGKTTPTEYKVYYRVVGNEGYGDLTYETPITVTIQPKEISLTWSDTPLTYNGQPQQPTATATGLETGDTCDVTVTGAQTDANPDNASTYTATAAGLSNPNYRLPAAVTREFSIARKPVTITAKPKTVPLGDTLTGAETSDVEVTGLLEGHTLGSIGLNGNTQNAGTVDLMPQDAVIYDANSADVTANYEITYAKGTMTVQGKVVYIKQNANGSWPSEAPPLTAENSAVRPGQGTTYSVTKTFEHYHVESYSTVYAASAESGRTKTYAGANISLNGNPNLLYLYYAVDTHDLVFYQDADGTTEAQRKAARYGDDLSRYTIDAPQKGGYTFGGWTTTPNVQLSALYEKNPGTDGKPVLSQNKTKDENGKPIPFALFAFSGTVPAEETKLYPIWIHDRVMVKLVLGDDTETPATMDPSQSREFIMDIGENINGTYLEKVTRDAYLLDGWFTKGGMEWSKDWTRGMDPKYADSDTGRQFNSDRMFHYYTATLTARWKLRNVRIVYKFSESDAADTKVSGTLPTDSDQHSFGSAIKVLNGTNLKKEKAENETYGYEFVGWEDKNGNIYRPGETFTYSGPEKLTAYGAQPGPDSGQKPEDLPNTIKLTARFKKLGNVVFDSDGGTVIDSLQESGGTDINLAKDATSYKPTKEGYNFDGWYRKDDNTQAIQTSYTVVSAQTATFKAKWTAKDYTITFDTAGGSAISGLTDNKLTQGYETAIASTYSATGDNSVTKRTGYEFKGWGPALPAKMPLNGMTVTAIWEPKKYTVSFNTGTGGTQIQQETHEYDSSVSAPAADPTREGYTFQYWEREIKGEDGQTAEWKKVTGPFDMPAYDLTMRAVWKENQNPPDVTAEAPEVPNADTVRVTNPEPGVEYIIVPEGHTLIDSDWTNAKKCTASGDTIQWNDRTPATNYTVYARRYETTEAWNESDMTIGKMASAPASCSVETPKAEQAAPAVPSPAATSPVRVEINPAEPGEEYILLPKRQAPTAEDWTRAKAPGDDGKVVWDNLTPNTEYEVYARMRETSTQKPSPAAGPASALTPKDTLTLTKPQANALTYNGQPQALVTAASVTAKVSTLNPQESGVRIEYRLDNGEWSETIPAAKNAGTYTVYYRVTGGDRFENITEDSVTVTVERKEISLNWNNRDLFYNGAAQKPAAEAVGVFDGDQCNVTVGEDYAKTDVGTNYPAMATALSNPNYKLPDAEEARKTTFSIQKGNPEIPTPPKARDLTFNGQPQQLIDPGVTTGGKLLYSLDQQTWSETPPTGTAAGEYKVYYRVEGNDNYNEKTDETWVVTATVKKKEVTLTWGDAVFTYDGQPHAPSVILSGLADGYANCAVSVSGQETNARTGYTAAALLSGADSGNYTLPAASTCPFRIDPREITLNWGTTSFTYDGAAKKPAATAGGLANGDVCNVNVNGERTDAGSGYTARAVSLSNPNYKLPAGDSTTFEIRPAEQKAPELTPAAETMRGKRDGAVTGLTSAMEYSVDGGATYLPITDILLSGGVFKTPGTFHIRYAAYANHNAGPAVQVTVDEGPEGTVTFESKGGSGVERIAGLSYGDKLRKPDDPTREGFTFLGWYADETLTRPWNFDSDAVTEVNTTLYAYWTPADGLPVALEGVTITLDGVEMKIPPEPGDKLTAVPYPDKAENITFQWYRVDAGGVETPIPSASKAIYTVTGDDTGCILRVKATQAGETPIVKQAGTRTVESKVLVVEQGPTEAEVSDSIPAADREKAREVAEGTAAEGLDQIDASDPEDPLALIIQEVREKAEENQQLQAQGLVNTALIPNLKVETKEYEVTETSKRLVLDIDAFYTAYASNKATAAEVLQDASKVKIGEGRLDTTGKNVGLTVPLPDGFVPSDFAAGVRSIFVTHKHTEGRTYIYAARVGSDRQSASFVNPNGFSDFIITLENPAAVMIGEGAGARYYPTLADAVADAANGETLVLLKALESGDLAGVMPSGVGSVTLRNDTGVSNAISGLNISAGAGRVVSKNENADGSWTFTARQQEAPSYHGGGGGSSGGPAAWYPVTVGSAPHGGVRTDRISAQAWDTVTLTLTPDAGYRVGTVTVTDADGREIPVSAGADGTYTFTMPGSPVTVAVSYRETEAAPALRTPLSPRETGVADWLICDEHIVYLNGYTDGSIRPTGKITRAETAMIFYRLLRDRTAAASGAFSDVPPEAWYSEAVGTLSGIGMINGYEDGSFRPDNPITRAEFAAIATRFASVTGGGTVFTDVPSGYWAERNIAAASDCGWINGYGDGTYGPVDYITRAQAATIVNHMLGRAADQAYVLANREKLARFSDLLDPEKWYYFDMVEASTAHDYTRLDGAERWTANG